MEAVIAGNATRMYFQEEKRPLTQGTVGGIVQIQSFEIVATHIGPRSSRLALYVKGFKFLGPGGEGRYGIPRPIEVIDKQQHLIERLKGLRDREPPVSNFGSLNHQSSSIPLSAKNPSPSSSGDPSQSAMEDTFMTQLPLKRCTTTASLRLDPYGDKEDRKKDGLGEKASTEALPKTLGGDLVSEHGQHAINVRLKSLKAGPQIMPNLNTDHLVSKALKMKSLAGKENVKAASTAIPNGELEDNQLQSATLSTPRYTRTNELVNSNDCIERVFLSESESASKENINPASAVATCSSDIPPIGLEINMATPELDRVENVVRYQRIRSRDIKIAKDQEALLNAEGCRCTPGENNLSRLC